MRWKQFFTPVASMDSSQAKAYMEAHPGEAYTLLDVRQPKEYRQGHIPGAVLIPIGELDGRLGELDPAKPTLVYCAIGGRSRVAAQMLAGKEFKTVYNLAGGIKAWNSGQAVGAPEDGLSLFRGDESLSEVLAVAFGLEQGLRDFYLSMIPGLGNPEAAALFQKLADIEIRHQERILQIHKRFSGQAADRRLVESKASQPALEGGLTTEEYLELYHPDRNSVQDILSLALAIEAQALDLYQRAATRAGNDQARAVLRQIADEERTHIRLLGKLMD